MLKRVSMAVLLLACVSAADTMTLQLVGTPYGVNGPYSFLVNGTPEQMVCYSASNFISSLEIWTAQVYTIGQVSEITGPFAGSVQQYNEIGLLSDQLFLHPGDAAIQSAIWAVLGTGGSLNGWDAWAVSYLSAHPGYLTGDAFVIPVGDFSRYLLGMPQPFVQHPPQQTPEPTTLAGVGTGLFALAGMVRRRKARHHTGG